MSLVSLVSLVSRWFARCSAVVEEGGERSVGEGNERDIMVVRKERRGVGVRRCTRRRSSEGVQSRTPSQPLQVEVGSVLLMTAAADTQRVIPDAVAPRRQAKRRSARLERATMVRG